MFENQNNKTKIDAAKPIIHGGKDDLLRTGAPAFG